MSSQTSVELIELTRRFGDVTAVSKVSLSLDDGEFFSLIGPSGCGKTTTLRMIAGFATPTSGQVRVHGRDITHDPPYRRPLNTVFQHYALFPHLNVFENVAFGLRERGAGRTEIAENVRRILDLVELSAREIARPRELSGGQQQRVALARALVLEPEVLLLDEPLGALDLKLRRQMQELLKQVQKEVGITFVYVTHDQEEAFSMSDRVAVMRAGVLEQIGVPEDVYRYPVSAFVADFVGVANRFAGTIKGAGEAARYRIELDYSKDTLEICGAPRLSGGDRVWVVVRPEAARLGEDGRGDIGGEARVIDASFLGPNTVYKFRSSEFGDVTATTSGQERRHPVGSTIRVGWPVGSAWMVPMTSSEEKEEPEHAPAKEGIANAIPDRGPRAGDVGVGPSAPRHAAVGEDRGARDVCHGA